MRDIWVAKIEVFAMINSGREECCYTLRDFSQGADKFEHNIRENTMQDVDRHGRMIARRMSTYLPRKPEPMKYKLYELPDDYLGIFSPDPFKLTLNGFLSLSLDETRKLHERAGDLCEHLLDEAWERGMKQAIICDGEIIYETKNEDEPITETIKREAKQRDKPCYAFFAPPIIEEASPFSSWTNVSGDDYYPTLLLNLSPLDSSDLESNRIPICTDFDTGNKVTKAFDIRLIGDFLGKCSPFERRVVGGHAAGRYSAFIKRGKLWVKDEKGAIHSSVCDDILLVEDWNNCALTAYSPNRIGFSSRDILRILRIGADLNPIRKTTRIYDASQSP